LGINLIRLNQFEIAECLTQKDALVQAATYTKIQWQALAAIWYREASFQVIKNAFQFDPVPPALILADLLEAYCGWNPDSKSDSILIHNYCQDGVDNFYSAAVFAACWLRHQCKFDLTRIMTPEGETPQQAANRIYADAFYGYNGRAYGPNPLDSPYVANELDSRHHRMHFRGTINGHWVDIIDRRPGALTVYEQLTSLPI
jgi:hypothetical protein